MQLAYFVARPAWRVQARRGILLLLRSKRVLIMAHALSFPPLLSQHTAAVTIYAKLIHFSQKSFGAATNGMLMAESQDNKFLFCCEASQYAV